MRSLRWRFSIKYIWSSYHYLTPIQVNKWRENLSWKFLFPLFLRPVINDMIDWFSNCFYVSVFILVIIPYWSLHQRWKQIQLCGSLLSAIIKVTTKQFSFHDSGLSLRLASPECHLTYLVIRVLFVCSAGHFLFLWSDGTVHKRIRHINGYS